MKSVHPRRVNPRRCTRPRSADLGAWGAQSARYVRDVFISFSLIVIFLFLDGCFFLQLPAVVLLCCRFSLPHHFVPARDHHLILWPLSVMFLSVPDSGATSSGNASPNRSRSGPSMVEGALTHLGEHPPPSSPVDIKAFSAEQTRINRPCPRAQHRHSNG